MFNLFYSYYDSMENNRKEFRGSFSSIEKAQERVSQLEDEVKVRYDNLLSMAGELTNFVEYKKETAKVLDDSNSTDEFSGYTIEPIVLNLVK